MSTNRPGITSTRVRTESLCLGLLALLLFLLGVWKQPFVGFETRFAVFAQEMLRHGPTLFPTTYGRPYPDYPVSSTILIWLCSLPFGAVTKFSAVLPTALASSIIVIFSYRLFATDSRRWALLAVGFEFLTVSFLAEARSISVDQMVSAITVCAFYLTYAAHRERAPVPMGRLALLLVAGFLIRGPIGVVVPAGVVLSHALVTGDRRTIVRFSIYSGATLVLCGTALWGLARLAYGDAFAGDIVRMQVLGRFAESEPLPRSYYFVSSFGNYALSYPVAVLVAAGVLFSRFRPAISGPSDGCGERNEVGGGHDRTSFLLLLVAWVAIVFVGLSIPETKKVRYVLPAVPALAGLAAYPFVVFADRAAFIQWLRRGIELVLLALPAVAAVFFLWKRSVLGGYDIHIGQATAVFTALFVVALIVVVRLRHHAARRTMGLMLTSIVLALYTVMAIVEPANLRLHDTSRFVQRIEALCVAQPGNLVFFKENPDGFPIKYLVNVNRDLMPEFAADVDVLRDFPMPVWVLTREKNLDTLVAAGLVASSQALHDRFGELPYVAVYLPAAPAPLPQP